MATSSEWFARARESLVGGVNSPVRCWRGVGGDPLFFHRGKDPISTALKENGIRIMYAVGGPWYLAMHTRRQWMPCAGQRLHLRHSALHAPRRWSSLKK